MFDVVIIGATGFTGKWVLAQMQMSGSVIAVAGRSETRLNALQLRAMCQKTRLVMNCTGPYRLLGENVVRACAESGTDYIDICGEPAFIETMSLKYNHIARDSGSIIISACGFDSIPSELGMVFLQKWFDDDKCHLDGVEAFLTFPKMHPGYSAHATTWDCAVMGFANQAELGAIRKQLSLAKIPGRLARRSNLGLITNVTGITGRAIPFVGSDASIVRRSQHRLMIDGRRDLQAARFNMYTVVETTTGLVKLVIGGFIFVCLTKFEIGQNLLSRFASFFSFGMFTREGPSPASVAETSFAITFKAYGQSAAGDRITKTARVTGPEPGYDATSKIMASCANVVLGERRQITDYVGVNGGVFTTADALAKTSIYEKLAKRGIEYQKL